MEFHKFHEKFQKNFTELIANATHLYEVEVDKDELWNLYLDSFPAGTNNIYRTRREYDCSCCRHFVKSLGNVVVIENNQVKTIWDFDADSATFQPVVNALDAYIKSRFVTNVYVGKFSKIGTKENYEPTENGGAHKWEHFYVELPSKFVDRSSRSVGDLQGDYRDTKNVFKRSLDEITVDSLETVLELIQQNSLYKGEEWKSVLTQFLQYKNEYDRIATEAEKNNYTWAMSTRVGSVIGRIRNHSIGTLLVNIGENMDLDMAVRKYEQIVAPSNYKRPKAIYTKKMIEDAKKKLEELGYMNSLTRRYATLDDITVNNILFSNKDAAKRISGASVFDEMMAEATSSPKKFSKVEEVSIDKFVTDILPTASDLEVYFENKHAANMVSLIAPKDKDTKTMFKWDNGFSWAYTGNLTDSMKERVKAAGGKVDGDLRFSIQWNEDGNDSCDLDAHCIEASGYEIYFGSAKKPSFSPTKGQLDVDIISPGRNIAVENITWANRRTMRPGKYRFFVHQYSGSANKGFRAEIEFDGQIYSFDYNKSMRYGQNVDVAEVTLDVNGNFTIKELLPSNISSRDVWGIKTNQFVPVSTVMYSPNYWDEQQGIGNKHYFFMLKDCVNPEQPNGFYNEFLKQELLEHKRVFEALGGKMAVESVDDQLSGIGFSSTLRNELVAKVKGATERIVKIKF